jgi:hypothetical protein
LDWLDGWMDVWTGLDWNGLHKLDHQERYRKREGERTRKRKKETRRREQTMHSEVPMCDSYKYPLVQRERIDRETAGRRTQANGTSSSNTRAVAAETYQ